MLKSDNKYCSTCGSQYEYSKLLDCMQCPICTPQKLVPFFMEKFLISEKNENNNSYCTGKHLCEICGKEFECTGETSRHDDKTNSGRCNGGYISFCPDHSIEEYRQQHIKNGELP